MDTLNNVINSLKIIGISIAGIAFIVLMVKVAVEPEMKGRYLKLTKHLLIATILITVSLALVDIPKLYYGDKIAIVDEEESKSTIEELKDKDCQGRETINIDGKWYVVTDKGWTLYNYYGLVNASAMSHAYELNIYSTVALKNVDALRLFSECQGTFKGYFAHIDYYRDQDGFIFPASYNYSQYENAKNNSQNEGGDSANNGG